ncbi:MAG: hypothetical protein ACI959_000537 [Limisphaerales bacterium]|jgi:hypothetical protein
MQRFLALIAILLIVGPCFSQNSDYKINWSLLQKKDGGMFAVERFVGAADGKYYVVSRPNKSNIVKVFDFNHKLIKSVPIRSEINRKPIAVDEVIQTKSGNYGVGFITDRKTKSKQVYLFDFSDLKAINKPPRKLAGWTYGASAGNIVSALTIGASTNSDASGINQSYDSTKVLITGFAGALKSAAKNKFNKYIINVFDENLEPIWDRELKLPYSDSDLEIENFQVSNSGSVIITGKHWVNASERKKGEPKYDYVVFLVTQKSMEEFNIEFDNAVPTDAVSYIDKDGKVYIGGMYTKRDVKYRGTHGTFLACYTSALEPIFLSKFPLSKVINESILSRRAQRKDKGANNFPIKTLIVNHETGNFTMIAEETYRTYRTSTSTSGSTRTTTYYHTNEIMVPTFDLKTGEQKNNALIEKGFVSASLYITSFTYGTSGGSVYLLFNDFKTKEERKDLGKQGKRTRYTDIVRINSEGQIKSSENLFTSKSIESEFMPKSSNFIGDGKILLIGFKGFKKVQYGLLDLDGK